VTEGEYISGIRGQQFDSDSNVFYDCGYIGDFISEYKACLTLQASGSVPSILHTIADPTDRRKVDFLHAPFRTDVVPINESQRAAIRSMKYNIEGIQGPPGTGTRSSN
jgi:hypothetical protein